MLVSKTISCKIRFILVYNYVIKWACLNNERGLVIVMSDEQVLAEDVEVAANRRSC